MKNRDIHLFLSQLHVRAMVDGKHELAARLWDLGMDIANKWYLFEQSYPELVESGMPFIMQYEMLSLDQLEQRVRGGR